MLLTGRQNLLIGLCDESHTAFVLDIHAFPSLTEYYAFVTLRGRHFAAFPHSRLDDIPILSCEQQQTSLNIYSSQEARRLSRFASD